MYYFWFLYFVLVSLDAVKQSSFLSTNNDLVDGNEDELNKEANEAHNSKSDQTGGSNLDKL